VAEYEFLIATANVLIGTKWPEGAVAKDAPLLAAGATDPAGPWHALERLTSWRMAEQGKQGCMPAARRP
jgi:hypothetical protein